MGWFIKVIENTAIVPLDKREVVARWMVSNCADAYSGRTSMVYDDLYHVEAPAHEILSLVFGGGHRPDEPTPQLIIFDSDNMEHMDFVTRDDEVCRFLAAVGTRGRILFGSLDGDNSGQFWGVEFGSGHYRRYKATTADINWNIGTSIPA